MPLSTFNSRLARYSPWQTLLLAGLSFAALVVPVELAIRAVEARYGPAARFGAPGSDATKLAWFLEIVAQGPSIKTLIVGNSQCEYGIKPSTLAEASNEPLDQIYSLTFSGTSALTGLEIARRLGLSPARIIVCLSPADLSTPMVERGETLLNELEKTARRSALGSTAGLGSILASLDTTKIVSRMLRASDPRYRRSLREYISLAGNAKDAFTSLDEMGRFLTTGRTGKQVLANGRYYIAYFQRGYLGLLMLRAWTPDEFDSLALKPSAAYYAQAIYPSYRHNGERLWKEAGSRLVAMKNAGADIVLVRMPVWRPFLEVEDVQTSFHTDLRDFARRMQLPVFEPEKFPPQLSDDLASLRDPVHLHDGSAQIFTQALARLISP